jgi:hypothetical protein
VASAAAVAAAAAAAAAAVAEAAAAVGTLASLEDGTAKIEMQAEEDLSAHIPH